MFVNKAESICVVLLFLNYSQGIAQVHADLHCVCSFAGVVSRMKKITIDNVCLCV
jgi:hypothetical protein